METTLIIVLVIYFGMAFSMFVHLLLTDLSPAYSGMTSEEEVEYDWLCWESYKAAYSLFGTRWAARAFCAVSTVLLCLATALAWPYYTWTLVVMPAVRRFRR